MEAWVQQGALESDGWARHETAFLGRTCRPALPSGVADEPVKPLTDSRSCRRVASLRVDTAQAERIGNILIARGARKGSVIFFLSHRAYESFTNHPFYDGLGSTGAA